METTPARFGYRRRSVALKPSLVEWKPRQGHSPLWAVFFLETFLGGMETTPQAGCGGPWGDTLKPSLVEWKPATKTGGVPDTIYP